MSRAPGTISPTPLRWIVLAALLLILRCGLSPPSSPADQPNSSVKASPVEALASEVGPGSAPAISRPQRESIGFRNPQALDTHWRKHRGEFGSPTRDEYLALAQALRDRPLGGPILEVERGDGMTSRFDRASGAFIVFEPDGTIRTFFRPNDGERYFRRQAARRR